VSAISWWRGAEWGRVRRRAAQTIAARPATEAGPSVPVEILGLSAPPEAGDHFQVVENEAAVPRDVAASYRQRRSGAKTRMDRFLARGSLEQLLDQIKTSELKELPLVVKADVQGSVEAIVGALQKLGTDEVSVRNPANRASAGVTESDVILAEASNAPIIAFNVRAKRPGGAGGARHQNRRRDPLLLDHLQCGRRCEKPRCRAS